MVNFRLFLSITIIFFIFSAISVADSRLILVLDKTQSELGRPIRAEIIALSIKKSLNEIDFKVLEENFGVITEYATSGINDARWPQQDVQQLKFKIYPRHSGKLIVPKLHIEQLSTKEISINVTDSSYAKPNFKLSENTAFQRQQITAKFTVLSSELSARLSISKSDEIKNFESTPLAFKRTKQKNGLYLLQAGWVISGFKSGQQIINFPPIEYSVSGVLRKKYFLPLQKINIKKLPNYIPPTLPVGKVSLTSELSQSGILPSDSLLYWKVKLSGDFQNAYQLPSILRQIKSHHNVKFYPANSERIQNIQTGKVSSSVAHSIPLVFLNSGFQQLPTLTIKYYDPVAEKISEYTLFGKTVFSLSYFLQVVVLLLLIISFLPIIKRIRAKWQQYNLSKKYRRQAIQLLESISNKYQLKESIVLLSLAEKWPENITVSQWYEMWLGKYHKQKYDQEFILSLSNILYSETQATYDELLHISSLLKNIVQTRKRFV